MTFTIAIVGRPNVGKSTLFNRLAGKQLAIVDDTPGVTRDWRESDGWLLDQQVRILDTAGLEENFDDSIQGRMRKQTEAAIGHADAILFVIDGRSGLTPIDQHFATWLRRQDKPVVLAVNKCENENAAQAGIAEAYSLGLGEPVPVSAAHGHGIEDLYTMFQEYFPEDDEGDNADDRDTINLDDIDAIEGQEDFEFEDHYDQTKPIKITIAGRPNVGKSTLLNALIKDQRVMTGPEAGITRDAIAVDWEYKDTKIKLVDTAGIRRKAKVDEKIEKMAVEDSMRAIRLAQIVIMVIDGNAILEKQDLQIAEHILDEGRALILAVNKWDSVDDKNEALGVLEHKLEHSLSQVRNIPVVTISALKGRNLHKLMDLVLNTYQVWNARVSTSPLNRWLAARESQHPAPLVEGRQNRLKYMSQIKTRPPTFALWVSRPKDLPGSYKRYITKSLAEDFKIEGVPIRLLVRTSKNPYKK